MSINASDSFPPGIPTVDGLTLLSGGSVTGSANFTDLTFTAFNGVNDSSGPYNISNSTVTYGAAPYQGYGSFSHSFTGHISTLTLSLSGDASTSDVAVSMTGQIDTVYFSTGSNGGDAQSVTTNQSSALTVSNLSYGQPTDGQSITLNAPNVTSLTTPSSMTLSDAATTFAGAFNQASVDAILASAVNGGSTDGGSLTIGGTSSTPSSTGAANVATLVSNGMTVSTN